MKKVLKKVKNENGSITSIVLVTILFFIIILSTALMVTSTQRKSQLDSDLTLKQIYQRDVDNAGKIAEKLETSVNIPIPKGYYFVGGTEKTGYVISDSQADENKYLEKSDVGRNLVGNQWVWVPVSNASSLYTKSATAVALSGSTGVTTNKYTASGIISGQSREKPGTTTECREVDLVPEYDTDTTAANAGFSNVKNMAQTMSYEYNEMINSIERYKGFYIGRYELTANGEKTGTPIAKTTWYDLYKKCKSLSINEQSKVRMIWGVQWDATCSWLEKAGYNIKDSSKWGNYKNYNTANGYSSGDKGYVAEAGSAAPLNTGFSEYWKANNIYDFAGNCAEWTQEASKSSRLVRGGYFNTGSYLPASVRSIGYRPTTNLDIALTTRGVLYIVPSIEN